jgi:phage-related protein
MATAYPNIIIGTGSNTQFQVKSLVTDFGDGYQEITPNGINFIVQAGNIQHPLITTAEAATVRNFLKQHVGRNSVVSIPNLMVDPTGATTLNVYLLSWQEAYDGHLFTITVSYREAFNV